MVVRVRPTRRHSPFSVNVISLTIKIHILLIITHAECTHRYWLELMHCHCLIWSTHNDNALIPSVQLIDYQFSLHQGPISQEANELINEILWKLYSDGLVQDCSISIALAMWIMQSCTKPSICFNYNSNDPVRSQICTCSKLTWFGHYSNDNKIWIMSS